MGAFHHVPHASRIFFHQTIGWWHWSLPDRLPQHHLKVQGIQIRSQIQHGRMAQHLILKTQLRDTQIIHWNSKLPKHSSSSSFSSQLYAIVRNSGCRLLAGCLAILTRWKHLLNLLKEKQKGTTQIKETKPGYCHAYNTSIVQKKTVSKQLIAWFCSIAQLIIADLQNVSKAILKS